MKSYVIKIKNTVFCFTASTVSMGNAATQTLAKTANQLNEKYAVYSNGHILDIKEKICKDLILTEIRNVRNIARQYRNYQKNKGIKTTYGLALKLRA